MALLLAKGEDFASWHGVEEFSAVYREAAVRLAAQRHPEGMPQLLELLEGLLVGVKQENEGFTRLVEELEQLARARIADLDELGAQRRELRDLLLVLEFLALAGSDHALAHRGRTLAAAACAAPARRAGRRSRAEPGARHGVRGHRLDL